ncbi:MAG: YIP1 family protein [Thermomicrobiales bacterium]
MQLSTTSFLERILGVLRLEPAAFEEIERDTDATWQAAAVVAAASILSGIGASIGAPEGRANSLIVGVLLALIFWALYALFAYVVGAYILKAPETSATFGEVLRALGFAYAPTAFAVLGFVPGVGGIVVLIASVWSLVASIIGLRQSLEVSTGRAVAIAIVAFLAMIVVLVLVVTILGIGIASIFNLQQPG